MSSDLHLLWELQDENQLHFEADYGNNIPGYN